MNYYSVIIVDESLKSPLRLAASLYHWQIVANDTKEVVQKEEQEAAKKAEETQAIADDAQRDLNEAIPALVGDLDFYRNN